MEVLILHQGAEEYAAQPRSQRHRATSVVIFSGFIHNDRIFPILNTELNTVEDMEGNFLSRGQLMSEEVERCVETSVRSRQDLTFCLLTALRLHGFEEPRETVLRRDHVHILSASRSERSRIGSADYHFLNSRVPTEVVSYGGIDIRVTDPISTCIHMAQFCTREETTVLFDQLLRRHQKNKMSIYLELEERIAFLSPQVNGSKRVRWAWRHCRMNTDSSMETRLRLVLEAARFPTPEVNPHFVGKLGQYDFYMDLAYCSLAIAFEYQGVEFHTGESRLTHDSMKAIAFMNSGGLIIPVTKEQLYDESMKKRLIETVRSLRRRRMRLSGRQRAGYAALFEKT